MIAFMSILVERMAEGIHLLHPGNVTPEHIVLLSPVLGGGNTYPSVAIRPSMTDVTDPRQLTFAGPDQRVPAYLPGQEAWVGDNLYRAAWLAFSGVAVIAADRLTPRDTARYPKTIIPGLRKAAQPHENTERLARRARLISTAIEQTQRDMPDAQLVFAAASAGASEQAGYVQSGCVQTPDVISWIDPAAMHRFGPAAPRLAAQLHMGGRWAMHQLKEQLFRPSEADNQHPLPYEGFAGSGLRGDISYNRAAWTLPSTLETLQQVPARAYTRLVFPEQSPNSTPGEVRALTNILGPLGIVIDHEHAYHSAWDDPARFRDTTLDTIARAQATA